MLYVLPSCYEQIWVACFLVMIVLSCKEQDLRRLELPWEWNELKDLS